MKFPDTMDCQKCNGVSLIFFLFILTSQSPSHAGVHPESPQSFARRLNMPVLDGCLSCKVGLQVWASSVWSKGVRKAAGGCYHLARPLHSWVSLWPWNSQWSIWDGSIIWEGLCSMFCSHTLCAGHRRHFCWDGNLGHRTEHPWPQGSSVFSVWGEAELHWREQRVTAPRFLGTVCVPSLSYLGALS